MSRPTPDDDAAFVALCAVRRRAALSVAARVAHEYGDRVRLRVLPDDAPLAPNCELVDAAGVVLTTLSSNAVATSILIGPAETLVQVDDDLDDTARDGAVEDILRDALDWQVGPA